jgi:DUF4097 and DUF4098 domain-containing protein YvlB
MDRAREIAAQVELSADGGRIKADGPRVGRHESWGVSWELRVPHDVDLDLETNNGGIHVEDVAGDIRFSAENGGISLVAVGGDVRGHTENGGLRIELAGDTWRGRGLDAETQNGSVTIRVPTDYSAELETGTVNGPISLDFPVTVRGRIGRRIATTLGQGGPMIRAMTTNGGVKVERDR